MSLSLSSSVLAQSVTSNINGYVTDTNGAPIPTATITLTNITIGLERTAQTNEQGFYSINAVPAGTYSIKAEATGFATLNRDNLNLASGVTWSVNFTLTPPELNGEVTVTDTSSASLNGVIDKRLIREVPITGRYFYELSLIIPGAAPPPINRASNLTINGSPSSENKYLVDGGETTNPSVGGAAPLPALDAIKSVQSVFGNFSADIGRFGGGLLNFAVDSGSNDFHGSASFYFRDDSLQALPPFGGSSKPAFGSQRLSLSIGGPIKKDVAFFFAQFERRSNKEVTTAGTRDVIQRRIVPGFAAVPSYATSFTTKFDFNLRPTDTLTASYSLEDGHGITPGLSQSGRLQEETNFQTQFERQHQFVSSWTSIFRPNLVNMALFNFVTSRDESKPVTSRPQIVFPSLNVGANFHGDRTSRQRRIQIKDDVNWQSGQHSIRFGADYNHLSLPEPNNFNLFGPGIIFVPCDFAGEAGCPAATNDNEIPVLFSLINRQTLANGPAPFGTRGVIPAISDDTLALYVQDDYRITPDFRLNLGLRWDYDHDYIGLNQTNQARQGRRKPRKKNAQPRVGIVWTIGKVIIRGGYGTHYQQNYLQTRQLELLADGTRLPLVRSFGGTLSNPFSGIGLATPPDIFVTNNDLKEQFAHTFSASGEIDLGPFQFSTALVTRRGRNSNLRVEVNRNEDGSRVNNQFGSVLETQSIGRWSYDGLSFNVARPFRSSSDSFFRRLYLNSTYTLSRTNDQANELISFLSGVSDPSDPGLDRGPSSYDARHRFVLQSIVDIPHNISISPTINAQSSVPFEIIQNHDFSEGSASGFYRLPVVGRNAGSRQLRTGADVNQAIDAFNSNPALVLAHGGPIAHVDPNVNLSNSYFTVALRVSKRWSGETKSFEIAADIFNLFNRTNVRGLSGANSSGLQNNVESPNFGRPLGITAGGGVFDPGASRALQLMARFTF